jgi:uncharacterized protein (TIGR00251 family)
MQTGWCRYDAITRTLKLTVHIQPKARSTALAGLHGDALKIRVAAPAVDNKANGALAAFIAEVLGVPLSKVALVGGTHSRRKILKICDATPDVISRLEPNAAG